MWSGPSARVIAWGTIAVLAVAAPAEAPPGDALSLAASDLRDAQLDPAATSFFLEAIPGLELRQHEYIPAGRPPVALRFFFKPGAGPQADRVVDAAGKALALFDAWFGPYPYSHLTFVDASWRSAFVGAAYPGLAVIATRWLAPEQDVGLERFVVAAVARMYWLDLPLTPEGPAFREGLVRYAGTRGIHETLENRNFASVRLVGGFVPVVVRSLSLSPSPWDPRPRVARFDEVDGPAVAPWRAAGAALDAAAARSSLALQTLERYIGWPALQQALAGYRERLAAGDRAVTLEAVVSEQRGHSMTWFFDEALNARTSFDYAVGSVATVSLAGESSRFLSEVVFRRLGDAVFAHPLPALVRFGDGSELREWLDGRLAERRVTYTSAAPVALVSVDPEVFLLLDVDRANNTRAMRRGFHQIGLRLALTWAIWLQDVMMSCTAPL